MNHGDFSCTTCYWYSGNQELLEEDGWSGSCLWISLLCLFWWSAEPKFRFSWMFNLFLLYIFPERKITGPCYLCCSKRFYSDLSLVPFHNSGQNLQFQSWFKSYALGKKTKPTTIATAFAANREHLMVNLSTWQWTCTRGNLFLLYMTACFSLFAAFLSLLL